MNDLNERAHAFESRYAHDNEMKFKAEMRRDKLLGLWAAALLGKAAGHESEAYAKQVVEADFEEKGDDDVLRKVLSDLQTAGKGVTAADVRKKMDELLIEAKAQVFAETN
jgi:hypothetical protein